MKAQYTFEVRGVYSQTELAVYEKRETYYSRSLLGNFCISPGAHTARDDSAMDRISCCNTFSKHCLTCGLLSGLLTDLEKLGRSMVHYESKMLSEKV